VRRIGVIVICCMVSSCADSVDQAARRAYELTLPVSSDGSGWSVRRDASGRVATWQIRIETSWDQYAAWVQPQLLKDSYEVVVATPSELLFRKSLKGDSYAVEIRAPEPTQAAYVTATFTAQPF